jgi:hypothetical protein
MDLHEVGCWGVDWIGLPQDRDRWLEVVNAAMKFGVQENAVNFLASCKPVSFSRRALLHEVSE